ncbi:hypothetical protein [Actinomadura hibisca]|uniref:hypothetical protein n=1 Tax=Actinomadura hibisca TaxID=68565 RepID=UPI00082EE656|nr:hypothetical protein [Actinomadura hibisca]
MKRTSHRRRPLAAVLAVMAGLVAVPAVPGLAGTATAADRTAARASSQWLARQLSAEGTLENPMGGALPDHGLMIDTLFALHASGDGALAAPVARYLDEGGHASDYFTWDGLVPGQGYDAVIVGGAAAKVLVAAQVSGHDPRDFGGYDMVAETKGAIMRSGPDKGRISDYSKNPDLASSVSNNANVFGQALGVIGLAGAGENDRPAIDKLVTQQCSEGYFRIFFGYVPTTETGDHVTPNGNKVSTCDEGKAHDQSAPDGDATGLALSALLAARGAGADGLDEPIAKAVAWLKAHQDAGGGWGGGVSTEAPNTNSTGLIVQALADAGGAEEQVDKGTAYLKSAQATSGEDSGNALADHIGAIAYNPQQYQDARSGGIGGLDTWVRAGAQASLGLSQVGFYDLVKGKIPGGGDPGPGPSPSPTGGVTTPPTPRPTATDGPKPRPTETGAPTPDPSRTHRPPPRPRQGTDKAPPAAVKPPSDRAGDKAPPPNSQQPRTVVDPPQSQAQPTTTSTPAARLGSYLAGKLVDGDHVEVAESGKTYVDYAATADLVLALRALGEQPVAVTRASRFLLEPDSVKSYAYGQPYEREPAAYAEPLAKLQIIARFLQPEPAAPKDIATTVTKLRDDLAGLRNEAGRFADKGSYGDADKSVRRHAWAVLATTAGSAPGESASSLDVLLKSQCADGTFPAELGSTSCARGDLTATATALAAVNAQPRTTPTTSDAAAGNTSGVNAVQAVARVNGVPAGWSRRRITALDKAIAALNARSGDEGVVRGANGAVDVLLTASLAEGRQVSGQDTTGTARALGALLRSDGGMARPPGTGGDVPTSIAAAPGVAGRSWTSAPSSPVTMVLRGDARTRAAARDDGRGAWFWVIVVGGALVSVVLLAVLVWLLSSRGRPERPRPPGPVPPGPVPPGPVPPGSVPPGSVPPGPVPPGPVSPGTTLPGPVPPGGTPPGTTSPVGPSDTTTPKGNP